MRRIFGPSPYHRTSLFKQLNGPLRITMRRIARRGRWTPFALVCDFDAARQEVFELVIRGDTDKQVGRALCCTERTIKAHRQRVMKEVQVRSLAELVSFAERVGVFVSATEHRRRSRKGGRRYLRGIASE